MGGDEFAPDTSLAFPQAPPAPQLLFEYLPSPALAAPQSQQTEKRPGDLGRWKIYESGGYGRRVNCVCKVVTDFLHILQPPKDTCDLTTNVEHAYLLVQPLEKDLEKWCGDGRQSIALRTRFSYLPSFRGSSGN
jgi:hypothetical protein